MWVCACNGVKSEVIESLVDAGVRDADDVTAACGAGGDCGRCLRTIEQLIRAAPRRGQLVSS